MPKAMREECGCGLCALQQAIHEKYDCKDMRDSISYMMREDGWWTAFYPEYEDSWRVNRELIRDRIGSRKITHKVTKDVEFQFAATLMQIDIKVFRWEGGKVTREWYKPRPLKEPCTDNRARIDWFRHKFQRVRGTYCIECKDTISEGTNRRTYKALTPIGVIVIDQDLRTGKKTQQRKGWTPNYRKLPKRKGSYETSERLNEINNQINDYPGPFIGLGEK